MRYNLTWLTDKHDQGETINYIFFWGHTNKTRGDIGKFIFSQWYPASFTVDEVEYKTAEHWMMARKALLFSDNEIFQRIVSADKPGEVKELGRKIKGFEESIWNDCKFDIVTAGNIHKFNQHKRLLDYLLATGEHVIVEASPTDRIWGIGRSQDTAAIDNPHSWNGDNLLGFALMEARAFLRTTGRFTNDTPEILPPWKDTDTFRQTGEGEQSIVTFRNYFNSLSPLNQKIYELNYPAPGGWHRFYQCNALPHKNT